MKFKTVKRNREAIQMTTASAERHHFPMSLLTKSYQPQKAANNKAAGSNIQVT